MSSLQMVNSIDSITFDDIEFNDAVMNEFFRDDHPEIDAAEVNVVDACTGGDEINFDDIDFGVILEDQPELLSLLNAELLNAEPPVEVKQRAKRVIHDPSDPNAQCDITARDITSGGEVVRSDRRNANKKNIVRECLTARDHQRFADSMMIDSMSLPTVDLYGKVTLSMSDIADELRRSGTEARGLSTIVLSRASLAENVTFGMYEAHGTTLPTDMDIFEKVVQIKHLVGHVMPVFGQTRKPPSGGLGDKSKIYQNHTQVARGEFHPFAFEPVIIATSGDGPGDSGEIIAQGIVVSNKGLNFPVGDARRVSFGRKSEFEESMCWVLITHYYEEFITYAAIGPPTTKKNGDSYRIVETSHKNKYDNIFRWTDFMNNNTHLRGCGVSLFGFTDTKQVGKDLTRRLFPWSVSHAMETLRWYRERGQLDEFLINSPMTTVKRASGRADIPSGMDARRFLLAELLLTGTPLENMMNNARVEFPFYSPSIPGGGRGLYTRLHDYSFGVRQ